MKKTLLLILALVMCVSLCSCQKFLKKAKAYVTGTEESEMPADFLESRSTDDYSYDVYKDHVVITGYLGAGKSITIPKSWTAGKCAPSARSRSIRTKRCR